MVTDDYLGAIVIPTLNEAQTIEENLKRLQSLRHHWLLILVDGGSNDGTCQIATPYVDEIALCQQGRARQQNEGALRARQHLGIQNIVVFLHTDTRLPEAFSNVMKAFLVSGSQWGRFDVRLSGERKSLRLIEMFMNFRSRYTGIATGDQTLFFKAESFWQLGGFPMLALMEDIEISKRAKRLSAPFCVKEKVITSSRKWEQHGIWKTVGLMWFCRAAFFFGVRAQTIHRWYYRSAQ